MRKKKFVCLEVILINIVDVDKSAEKCAAARQEADEAIKQNKLLQGLSHLNQAVMLAPTEEDNLTQLAESLFHRSKTLLALGHHDLALRDASLAAIKGGFPETSLFSLYLHQAKCHEAIKCAFEAQKCYNRAISALDKSDLDQGARDAEKRSIQEALNSLNKDKTAKAKIAASNKNEDVLDITRKHSKYQSLSKHVGIKYSKEHGRFAVAMEDIRPGTVLGIEDPIVSCLDEEFLQFKCLNCFKSVLAGLPCHTCSNVVFCSLECRRQAISSFHKYECQNMHLLKTGPNYLALRAVTQNSVEYFLENRLKKFENYNETSGTELEEAKSYTSNDMKNLFNLSTKNTDIEKEMEIYMIAAYLLKILQSMNYFDLEKKTESSLTEEEVYIGMLLSRFVAVAESNSHLICQAPNESQNIKSLPELLQLNFEPQQIGFGINSTLAFFNHSCNPNTVKIQRGKKTFLIASQNIKKGDEIFDNYGSLFYTTEKVQRNNDLGFECNCEACEGNWQKYRFLSDKIDDPSGDAANVGEAARRQLEKGRAANNLMQKMNSELGLGHFNKVLLLSGEYRKLLDHLVTHPHRFYFNTYMIMFYCYWIRYGNKN